VLLMVGLHPLLVCSAACNKQEDLIAVVLPLYDCSEFQMHCTVLYCTVLYCTVL